MKGKNRPELSIRDNDNSFEITVNGSDEQRAALFSILANSLIKNSNIPADKLHLAVDLAENGSTSRILASAGYESVVFDLPQLKHGKGGADNGE